MANPTLDFGDEQVAAAVPEALTSYPDAATGIAGSGPVIGPGSLSLTMVLPGALPDTTGDRIDADPAGEPADTTNQDIALSALEFKHFVEPKFPRNWRRRRVSGWVEVRFRITTNGRTDDITVIAAEPGNRFERSAIAAISQWRFKPVYVDGVATEKYSAIRLRFEFE
jgi:protein TonB